VEKMLTIKGILWGEMPQIIHHENPRKQIQCSQNNAFTQSYQWMDI